MKLGEYEIFERIGCGGMAEVYRGRAVGEEGFEKPVAIKRILPNFGSDARFVSMLVQESRIHASLHHRNIVQIHDLGLSEEGEYFIVLEYVDGRDLGALLDVMSRAAPPGNRVGDALALYVATELGEGVHYAHQHLGPDGKLTGLVHRDVSPSNVLLSYAGEVKLSDFGLAKQQSDHSVIGSLKGKLEYMSPEQARRQPLDRRSDLFSLGAVLYEMLTGERLRQIHDEMDGWRLVASGVMATVRNVRPDIPRPLERLLARALAPDPDDRFADCEAFVTAAREALDELPRPTSGEAAEMQLLLRSFLPPGAPRMKAAPSRVIRIASEFLPGGELAAHMPSPANDAEDRDQVPTDKVRRKPTLRGVSAGARGRIPSGPPEETTPVADIQQMAALADGNLFLGDEELAGTKQRVGTTSKTSVRARPGAKGNPPERPPRERPAADSLNPVAGEITGETKVRPRPGPPAAANVHIPDVATRAQPPIRLPEGRLPEGGAPGGQIPEGQIPESRASDDEDTQIKPIPQAIRRAATPPPPESRPRSASRRPPVRLPGMPAATTARAPTPPPPLPRPIQSSPVPPPMAAVTMAAVPMAALRPRANSAPGLSAGPSGTSHEPPRTAMAPPPRSFGAAFSTGAASAFHAAAAPRPQVMDEGVIPYGGVVPASDTPVMTPPAAPMRGSSPAHSGRSGLITLILILLSGGAAAVHYLYVPLPILAQWSRPAKLLVTSNPAGAVVTLDGVKLPDATPLLVDVRRDRQDHVLEVEKTGFQTARHALRYDREKALGATIALQPEDPETATQTAGAGSAAGDEGFGVDAVELSDGVVAGDVDAGGAVPDAGVQVVAPPEVVAPPVDEEDGREERKHREERHKKRSRRPRHR